MRARSGVCRASPGGAATKPAAQEFATQAVVSLEDHGGTAELAAANAELARLDALAARPEAGPRAERAIEIAHRVGATEIEADATITLALARHSEDSPDWETILRSAADLAVREGLDRVAERAWQNLFALRWHHGADVATIRRIHNESLEQLGRFGRRTESTIQRETFVAFHEGDWDRCLDVIARGRSATLWSTARDLTEAVIRAARHGPAQVGDVLEAARRRGAAAQEVSDRATWLLSAGAAFVAGDLSSALRGAEPAAEFLALGAFSSPHEAAAVAIVSAEQLGEDSALERWLRLAEARYTGGVNRYEEARAAFAEGIRARRANDRGRALERFGDAAERADALMGIHLVATLARLERADILVASGERDAALGELEKATAFWRKAKAAFYLGRIAEWARERGLDLVS